MPSDPCQRGDLTLHTEKCILVSRRYERRTSREVGQSPNGTRKTGVMLGCDEGETADAPLNGRRCGVHAAAMCPLL